jgi:lipopolysaccharide/colanic/teichoic acid biosynthesis glycosyltransferase
MRTLLRTARQGKGTAVLVGPDLEVEMVADMLAPRRRRNGHGAEAVNGDLLERLQEAAPDEVYFVVDGQLDEDALSAVGSRLLMDGVAVHFVLAQSGAPPVRAEASRIGGRAFISLYAVNDRPTGRIIRRVIDLTGALVMLLLLAPVFATVSLLVWWRLGRPIVFVQQRIGKHGRLFRLYKFRSMVANAEEILRASPERYQLYIASNYKLPEDEDPRVTPLGRFLRRTSLDELPQLWNVVRGDMGLVGPRPIVPDEIASYGDYGRMLVRVKPGLTGQWQVSGRSTIGYPERARMELRYLGERSLARDLAILFRTLPAIILKRGAL